MIQPKHTALSPTAPLQAPLPPSRLAAPPAQEALASPHDQVQLQTPVSLPAEAEEKPRLKEATGEMAEMLGFMEAAEERLRSQPSLQKAVEHDIWTGRAYTSSPIAMLDEGAMPAVHHSESIDGWLKSLAQADSAEEISKAPSDHPKSTEKPHLLGGHLGIEGGEKIAEHALAVKAEAHGVIASSGDTIDLAVSGGRKAAHHGAEVAGEVHGSSALHEVAQHGGETAGHAMSGLMAGVTSALAGASGVLGGAMLIFGFKNIKHGLEHKDAEHTIEGVNHTIVGTRSLAAATTMAGHVVHGSEVLTTVAGIAKSTLTPLGVVHGAIDAGIGAKQVYDGVRARDGAKVTKGALGIGLGGALIAAAAGAGLPAIVAAGVFLTGKVVHGVRQSRLAHQQQQAESPPA